MKRLLYILPLLLWCTGALAQQDAHYSQYFFNGLVLNPAYAGSRGTLSSTLFVRSQWTGFEGAPLTQSASAHIPGKEGKYGYGLSFSHDRIGYVNQWWVNASYAFRLQFKKNTLALGLQGGLLNYRIRWQDARVLDPNDPMIGQQAQSRWLPNAGFGAYFYGKRYYAGLSVPHIMNGSLNRNDNGVDGLARLYRHAFLTGGVVLGKGPVRYKPTFLIKYVEGAPLQADLNLMVLLTGRLWVGGSYRTCDAVAAMFDFQFHPMFRMGYAFEYTLSPMRRGTWGSHEFMLGFDLRTKDTKLINPRYF